MGLATIDPHSQKEHTEIHKIPKVYVNQARNYRDIAVYSGFNKEIYGHPDAIRHRIASGWPYISL